MKKQISKEQQEKIIYNYTVLNMGLKRSGKEFNFSDKIVKILPTRACGFLAYELKPHRRKLQTLIIE